MTNKTKTNIASKAFTARLPKLAFYKSFILWSVVSFCFIPAGFSQLKIYPLPQPEQNLPIKQKHGASARPQELTPLSLPFWDDFSYTPVDRPDNTLSNYPVDSLWENYKSIWISSGIALNAPSINVIAFNGLDSLHNPYSDQLLANGFRDRLTSKPINLTEVLPAERNSVYLSFFYQWYGNGEPPDAIDYLQVEFKSDDGLWTPAATIRTRGSFDRNVFYDTLVKVNGDKFFHDNFQFRFRNYGRLSGPFDTWNLDYVYLNKNRNPTDRYFPDQTIASTLSGLFGKYQSIPYVHFLDSNSFSHPKFDVFNVNNVITDLTYITHATYKSYMKGALTLAPTPMNLGDTAAINVTNGIIFERERRTVTLEHIPDGSGFDPNADSVTISLKVNLFTGDTYDPKNPGTYAFDYDPNYIPIDFRSNDTLRSDYLMHNYYAYDDGFSEYAIGLTQAGNRAAYLFDMLTSSTDTLIGFDIYFPNYGITNNLTAEFAIYEDNGGVPGTVLYTIPSYTIIRLGQNKFQHVPFDRGIVVKNKFYIGWKGPVGGTLKIGLDTNSDSGEKLFVNTNGSWAQNTDVVGNAMIRPVFGKGDVIVGIPEEKLQSSVFPNPNQGEFFISSTYKILHISNVTGQSIPFEIHQDGENRKVTLPNVSPGLYILRIQKGSKLLTSKIIVK